MTTSQLKLDIVKVINNLTDQIINLNEYNSMGLLMPEEYNINIKRLLKLRAASRNNLMMLSF